MLALKFSSWGDRISTHCMVLSNGICEYSVLVGNICYAAGTKTNSVLIMPPSRSCGWTMRHTPTCVKTRLPPHYNNDCCVLEPACPKMHFGFALNNMLPWSERTAKLNKLMTHLSLYYSSSLHHATHDRHSTNSKHVQCVYHKLLIAFPIPPMLGQKVSMLDGVTMNSENMDHSFCHYWDLHIYIKSAPDSFTMHHANRERVS